MAITTQFTVSIVPWPSVLQRASLEPDGLAVVRGLITGNATGGEVQHSILAPSSHLYQLRGFTFEILGAANNPVCILEYKRDWAHNLSEITDFDAYNFVSLGQFISDTWYNNVMDRNDPWDRRHLLGSFARVSDAANELVLTRLSPNVDTVTYDFKAEFMAWRRESIMQPGFIQQLEGRVSVLRAGLSR